ncbi:MAG: hypothetical protein QXN68_03980 [Thermoplasmata archaeon]
MKLVELYQRKLEDRKQKQKQAVKVYLKNSKVRKIAEKLQPYSDEVVNLVETHGLEEARKIINTALGMKLRENIFKEVLEYLKNPQK